MTLGGSLCPLLDIGFPQGSLQQPILCVSHPPATHQVIGPPYGRPCNASSGNQSPLQNPLAPSTIFSSSHVPAHNHFSLAIRYSKYCPLRYLLDDFKLSDEAHCDRPRFGSVSHHWQHALLYYKVVLNGT